MSCSLTSCAGLPTAFGKAGSITEARHLSILCHCHCLSEPDKLNHVRRCSKQCDSVWSESEPWQMLERRLRNKSNYPHNILWVPSVWSVCILIQLLGFTSEKPQAWLFTCSPRPGWAAGSRQGVSIKSHPHWCHRPGQLQIVWGRTPENHRLEKHLQNQCLDGTWCPWQQDWLYWGKLGWGPEWDPDTYPDPANMVKQLKEMNLKLVQIGLWTGGPHVNSWASKMFHSCCFGRCAEPKLSWFSYTMLHLFGANVSFLQTGSTLPKLAPIGTPAP